MMGTKGRYRRAERAHARRSQAWTWADRALVALLGAVMLLAIFAPALLADIGDTVVGGTAYDPQLGTSPSGLLLVIGRWLPVLTVAYALWYVREAPWQTRATWAALATGLLMNFARNVYSGQPATVSFLVLEVALIVLTWRLCTRPTIWETLADYKGRAEVAEQRAVSAEARADVAEHRWEERP